MIDKKKKEANCNVLIKKNTHKEVRVEITVIVLLII